MAAVCTNDAERLTNIGPHARIDLDPRFDASAASCEFCARFNNSVRRCGSGNNISRDGQAPSDAMLRRPCDVSPGEDCALCTQAPTRPAWVRARTAGFLGENIQAHLLRLKAKSKALQLFPKREQNELHRSDSFKFQRYERDREAQLAPKRPRPQPHTALHRPYGETLPTERASIAAEPREEI
ncbi:unnamed protein product [Notodromas monacha]|uniref:Uncharacterized protein n=1 Tax=Notodromas monacha TaxID=399045 RepID=A0A7R9BD57_9CRUS|nr:unnamed protein product [Notodromas monacha]CAG0912583.1 unnamed protein product [Notodromas monacha]